MKITKAIIITIISFFTLYCSSNITYAKSLSEIMQGGDDFISASSDEQLFNEEGQKKGTSQLYFITFGIGIANAVEIGIILGIQFITTGVEGQAKIKEKILPYAIGCVVIFGAFGIWKLVINITQSVF